ncbi:hypothetical protein [Nostoc sp. T09]|nr:hypothetical protein [Nostoc sp. T09]
MSDDKPYPTFRESFQPTGTTSSNGFGGEASTSLPLSAKLLR